MWHAARFRYSLVTRLAIVLLGVLLVASMTACGGTASRQAQTEPGAPAQDTGGATGKPAGGNGAAQPPVAAAATAAPARAAAGSGSTGRGQNSALPVDVPKQIIKTGTLNLVVKDVDSAVAQIGIIAQQYGGDVLQANNTKSGDYRIADVAIQVKSDQFEAAMAALRDLNGGVVERKVDKTGSQDVTEEYVDLKAQISNLEATERQLRTVMDKATRTEDILAVQREITSVRGQIDRLQGRANYLERRAAMSTINLRLEPPAAAKTASPGWRFSEVVSRAWSSSLAVLQGVLTVLISLAVFSWWLLPLLGLAWFAWRSLQRRRVRVVVPPPAAPPATPPAPAAD